ncbi:DUF4198 domain-containing protein [Duganella sp. FT92W]|uniref:DUF4198 domain-containing protein n=1 Tax=Pseudoduganella rivuli TaxID=2666085 RepID=A0A7X2LQT8_9BURK|nr:DUF4198 domain-containing protein [Pseudoduganella rivuli]MRV71715.1 DUF4198 domain-containing protein [Pseudoduganella rivuli]
MKKFVKAAAVTVAAAAALVSGNAQAHGIWFAQRATQLALVYGVGADDLDALKRWPLVTHMAGYDAAGKAVSATLEPEGKLLVVDLQSQPAIVTAVLDNGTWSRTPDGKWHKKGRNEVPDSQMSEKTFKYAVHLRAPLAAPLQPLPEQTLQVLPVEAKLPEQLGQAIKLRVLYQGKPVAGAKVLQDYVNDPDATPVLSGADGTVTLKVRNQGLNVIVAMYEVPSEESAKYDHVEHLASLSFVLAHKPE